MSYLSNVLASLGEELDPVLVDLMTMLRFKDRSAAEANDDGAMMVSTQQEVLKERVARLLPSGGERAAPATGDELV